MPGFPCLKRSAVGARSRSAAAAVIHRTVRLLQAAYGAALDGRQPPAARLDGLSLVTGGPGLRDHRC